MLSSYSEIEVGLSSMTTISGLFSGTGESPITIYTGPPLPDYPPSNP